MKRLLPLSILLLAVGLVFAPSLKGRFLLDDFLFIQNNLVVQELENLPRILTSTDAVGLTFDNRYYRPLTTLTFALDWAVWGDRPFGFRLTNLLLHAATVLLLLLLFRRLLGGGRPAERAALAGALLFAVHPAHAEPVAYTSARADLLCGMLLCASFLLFLRGEEGKGRAPLLLSQLAFLLALLSKIVALILPPLILIHLLLAGKRKGVARQVAPFALTAGAFLVVRALVVEMPLGDGSPLPFRIATAGVNLATYILHALFPFNLQVHYFPPVRTTLADPVVFLSWCAVGLALWGGWWAARRLPLAGVGAAWFLGGLLPVSGIFFLMLPTLIADRYLYIPLMGAALAAAAVLRPALEGRRWPLVAAALAAAAVLGGVVTGGRLEGYQSHLSFWQTAAAETPGAPLVRYQLGVALLREGKMAEAEGILKALDAEGFPHPRLQLDLALLALGAGDPGGAEVRVARALQAGASPSETHTMLGIIALEKGSADSAAAHFGRALETDPHSRQGRANLEHAEKLRGKARPVRDGWTED